jgi:MraZ protein
VLKHFTGTHEHKIDGKGRVSLPTEFRRVLDAVGSTGALYIVPQLYDPRALVVFTIEAFDRLVERHAATDYEDPVEQENMEITLMSESRQVQVDDNGRLVLAQDLREMINLDGEVCFAGAPSSFEIWEPGARRAFKEETRAAAGGKKPFIDRRGLV